MGRAEAVKRKAGECESQELDGLTNEIEQGFMQSGGWDACRHLLSTLARRKNDEIDRLRLALQSIAIYGQDEKPAPDDRDSPFDWRLCSTKQEKIARDALKGEFPPQQDGNPGETLAESA